ncbi:MAG: hypothetical protein IIT70_08275, partial [Clostridia bacterium]|nr:hypothetical protein [Clostridia bacterium]
MGIGSYPAVNNYQRNRPRASRALRPSGAFFVERSFGIPARSYLDYSRPKKIADIEDGEAAAVRIGFIGPAKLFRSKTKVTVTTVSIGDETGNMTASWFNQPYLMKAVPKEPGGYIVGTMDRRSGARFLRASFMKELPGVVPVYPLVKGLNQASVRKAVKAALDACLDGVEETLPE